jgi:hypothetical protein
MFDDARNEGCLTEPPALMLLFERPGVLRRSSSVENAESAMAPGSFTVKNAVVYRCR